MALNQLSGAFSDKIREIREDLTDILVDLTVNIDYPDEDIEEMTYEKLTSSVRNVKEKISERFPPLIQEGSSERAFQYLS